jgi:hypothetical protein
MWLIWRKQLFCNSNSIGYVLLNPFSLEDFSSLSSGKSCSTVLILCSHIVRSFVVIWDQNFGTPLRTAVRVRIFWALCPFEEHYRPISLH